MTVAVGPSYRGSLVCVMREGLSQDDLANEAEVSRSYMSELEKGSFYASL